MALHNVQELIAGAKIWMHAGMNRELASHTEIEFYMKDAGGNSNLQIKQIQEFIDEKVDLLIVSPNETIPSTSIIEKA